MNQYNNNEIFNPMYKDDEVDNKSFKNLPMDIKNQINEKIDENLSNHHPSVSGSSSNNSSNVPSTVATNLHSNKLNIDSKRKKINFKKQRSRSLPIINFKTNEKKLIIPLIPPININSLKEIDLNEILKNPQLRHDILFDPQLQFRPNLDGERGKRKRSIIDKYWNEIYHECLQFFPENTVSKPKLIRLPNLFRTLKEILLTILPNNNDKNLINEILDIDFIIQQLNFKNFNFLRLSNILFQIFKTHCAPIRDDLVNSMNKTFIDSSNLGDCQMLIQGLKKIFQILECMKLDIANHQIRLLRPVLIETAIDFEKDYYNQLINLKKFNINDSINWFNLIYKKYEDTLNFEKINNDNLKIVLAHGICELLSCQKMITSFPPSLTFDHTRLILLRADIRQIIVLKLCIILFQNLVKSNNLNTNLLSQANLEVIKQEILSIVTDNNGNVKWTKNMNNISLQLVKNLNLEPNSTIDTNKLLEFSNNWLNGQISPSSKVYELMENQFFKKLLIDLIPSLNSGKKDGILGRLITLVNFNWDVFGDYYSKILEN
ncbi:hypothetical protein CLIB1444_20S00276 [[Candida] jaroonii]|uniref:Uncharacterized protein n=1 Tax=[Candida] jaroonii TaxID=467808 RepID=A0ACA9YFE8_9ASCO|nr:hypothetical protein CLIB1444_20S00276 [[Candida] jaroonii]